MTHTDRGWLRGRVVGSALVLVALAACGGGDGDQSPKFQPSRIVSFGDSLSDVGSYNVPKLQAFVNGATLTGSTNSGKYTVNGASAKNWIELLAAQFGVEAPCAAQTGLGSVGPFAGLNTTPAFVDTCFAYGQGGARVTEAVGPGNPGLLAFSGTVHTATFANGGALGQLTTPLVTQVQRHLAKTSVGGKFSGDELVLMLAGGNDLFIQADKVTKVAVDTQNNVDAVSAASAAAGQQMQIAGTQFASLIMTQVVGKGAKHVIVVNLPDVGLTPSFAASRALGTGLTNAFNAALKAGLAGAGSAVVLVDAFTQSQDQFAHREQYGLSNVTTASCATATSLLCNSATLVAGADANFLYADSVHPTPYGYKLLAQFVTDRLAKAGLL
jgi:outer membrane lipase/esterase